jgi:hypothetical protein
VGYPDNEFSLGDFWKRISQLFRRVGGEAAHPPKKLGILFPGDLLK